MPMMFDSNVDPQSKLEARENVVTSIMQNVLFNPFKLKVLIPIVAYLLYGLGGDDDDKAQKKAQKLANDLLAVDKDSNAVAEVIKTIMFGRKTELFNQNKKAGSARASAMAEILSTSQAEFATAVPIFGVLAGFAPVSGTFVRPITDELGASQATFWHNLTNRKQVKKASTPFDKNGVSVRSYKNEWDDSLANLSAPTALIHDVGGSAVLAAEYNMTRYASSHRFASTLDTAIFAAYQLIPFAREPRGLKTQEMQEVIRKEKK